mmetsp:Transcript_924/g.3479  ORF Transcript_924/g.3479 Transcript_924/m.3479 type:complete len:120 (+) Transcript_924:3-362(+)
MLHERGTHQVLPLMCGGRSLWDAKKCLRRTPHLPTLDVIDALPEAITGWLPTAQRAVSEMLRIANPHRQSRLPTVGDVIDALLEKNGIPHPGQPMQQLADALIGAVEKQRAAILTGLGA